MSDNQQDIEQPEQQPAEAPQEAPSPAPEPEPAASAEPEKASSDNNQRFFDALGDDTDTDSSVLGKMDKRQVDRFSPSARATMRAMRSKHREDLKKAKAEREEIQAKMKAEREKLEEERKSLEESRLNYAKMFGSDDMREQLRAARNIDSKTLDWTNPADVEKLLDAKLAQRFEEFAKPALQESARIQRRKTIQTIAEEIPEFNEPEFQAAVKTELARMKEAGQPIAGQLRLVALQVAQKRHLQRKTRERDARVKRARESSRRVAKSTSTPANETYGRIPDEVIRQGGAAVTRYLKAHPKAKKSVDYRRKHGRYPWQG